MLRTRACPSAESDRVVMYCSSSTKSGKTTVSGSNSDHVETNIAAAPTMMFFESPRIYAIIFHLFFIVFFYTMGRFLNLHYTAILKVVF